VILLVIVVTQYLTGQVLANPEIELPISGSVLLQTHFLLGFFILIGAVVMTLVKLYLWLLRRRKGQILLLEFF